ncbi:MAG: hypothetical protein ACKUBY_03285 [Candidatus Moraniibacteriota bacterium]|jgi:hypothetical protein
MSMTLKEVLQSPTTEIQRLNDSNRGGTYLQIKCHKVHIPRSCKKEWGCVWFTIQEALEYNHVPYDSFTDQVCGEHGALEVSSDYQIIRMIFRERPFWFLHDILCCVIDDITAYNHNLYFMRTVPRVSFCGYTFDEYDLAHKAEPSEKVRRIFAQVLAEDYLSGAVLRNNRCLIEKCLHSGNPAVASVVKKFDLTEFYYQKIGDTVDFDRLPWDTMQLKATYFASIAFDALPKKQQNVQSFKILTERFQVN